MKNENNKIEKKGGRRKEKEKEKTEKDKEAQRPVEDDGAAAARRRRADAGPRLTGRDMVAMSWLSEMRAATLPQLQALLGYIGGGSVSDRRTRQIVIRWEALGLAERRTVWHGKPAAVWLTGSGARLVGIDRWRKPAVGTLAHTLAVSEVRIRLAGPASRKGWMCETQLRKVLPAQEHVPDGAVFTNGKAVAIEMELSPHGRKRVEAAIVSLLAARKGESARWYRVLYLCGQATLYQVTQVVEALSPEQRRRVYVRPWP